MIRQFLNYLNVLGMGNSASDSKKRMIILEPIFHWIGVLSWLYGAWRFLYRFFRLVSWVFNRLKLEFAIYEQIMQ